jgi:LmbE family N-acetylglucosaminyl deacetylase
MAPLCLLAVFAHPDDESFGPGGTLAKYTREGVDVHVCTVTDGAAGSVDPDATPETQRADLAAVRRRELACACEVLGVQLHMLDYRDSGMRGSPENQHPRSLFQADLDRVAGQLHALILELRPQVILTHDPTGGYFHPDHIKVNRAVVRAWDVLAGSEAPADWRPARLYYTVIPRSALKWMLRLLRLLRRDPHHFGRNRDVDLTQVGVPDEQVHVRLDVRPYLEVKDRASACHRSQGGGGMRALPTVLLRIFWRHEHFVQAAPEGAEPHDDLMPRKMPDQGS